MDYRCEEIEHIPVTLCPQVTKAAVYNSSLYVTEKGGQVYRIGFNGELINRFGTMDGIVSCLSVSRDGFIYVGSYNRLANFHGVLVYTSEGSFSHVLCRKIYPVDMAFDMDENVHICDNRSNTVKVYSQRKRKRKFTYGQNQLKNPTKIAVHPDQFIVVLETISLAVFSKTGFYLYEIDLDQHGILDFTITCDGALWITDNYFNLIRQDSNAFYTPPPPLRLLCQSTILLNMADLPVSLLPSRYKSVFDQWSRLIHFEVKQQTVQEVTMSGKMHIPTQVNGQTLAMILEEKIGIPHTSLWRHMKYNDKKDRVIIDVTNRP